MTTPLDNPVRTRFAPSPTGPLHIGGVRSALFSWLFARHHGGQFILRIEDTDQKRFVEGSVEMLTDALQWLGIDWDEGPDKGGPFGPYVQSKRLELYRKWVNWLVEQGRAYHAYDTPEELSAINEARREQKLPPGYDGRHRNLTAEQEAAFKAEGRPSVIRFKMPLEGETVCHDLIRGEVRFENTGLQDVVLLKSDGFPTYHLAHIVDDHLMNISHVTRANEWLPSLPVHWQLWDAFEWKRPVYAHLPVLLNPNGNGKLSKRHAGFEQNGKQILVLAQEFKDAGYLPEAVVNFLTNIGWNFGDEREIFDVEEAITRFELADVQATNSAFPIEKLDWLNGMYMREKLTLDELADRLKVPLEVAGLNVDMDRLRQISPLVQTRLKSLNDVVEMAGFFFHDEFVQPDPEDVIQKKMDAEKTVKALEAAYDLTGVIPESEFTTEKMHATMDHMPDELGLKKGQFFGAIRVAVTGQRISTPTFESMEVLGKGESLRRIQLAIDSLRTHTPQP